MLASVEQVHDLGGFGELGGGDVPDPGRAVADDRELADVIGAAADAFGFHQAAEDAGGLEGGDDATRPAPDGTTTTPGSKPPASPDLSR